MDAKLKAEWVKALRSGEYLQVRNSIGRVERKELCCLGVGAVVADPTIFLGCTDDATAILKAHGLDGDRTADAGYDGSIRKLIDMNDEHLATFDQIADYIEANIPDDEPVQP